MMTLIPMCIPWHMGIYLNLIAHNDRWVSQNQAMAMMVP